MKTKYDEAVEQLEALVAEMEAGQALSLDEFLKKATEAKQLIKECREHIKQVEDELHKLLQE